MASQTLTPAAAHSAQVVGHAFVEQYYHILHQSPETVHKFYQDSSLVSRPEPDGVMMTVTTMQAINEKILSLDYNNLKAEIKTADAQDSYMGGVTVLVTGCLTGMDDVKKPFSQSFFLAPQDKGYYVLNDVFRYMDESESTSSSAVANGVRETAPRAPLTLDPEPAPTVDHHVMDHATPISEEYMNNGAEVCDPSENEEGSVAEDEVVEEAANLTQNEVQQVTSTSVTDDTIKQSYASIVKVTKTIPITKTIPVYVPTNIGRATPPKPDQHLIVPVVTAPELVTPATGGNAADENSSHQEEAESRSIYIRGLPLNAEAAQVEEEFKRFGPIKPGGVQVRSNRQQGLCFGFVEFESSSSMQSAIEASPIMIGGRQAFIEEKKSTSSFRANGGGRGGRFATGRGGFRGRGNFGNRGYGRSDFGSRGEFSGRGRGPSSGQGYQRVNQNINGRGGRSGGMN